MRNASKNTIKKVMRNAELYRQTVHYYDPRTYCSNTKEAKDHYFLFNSIGSQIYTMSKGGDL